MTVTKQCNSLKAGGKETGEGKSFRIMSRWQQRRCKLLTVSPSPHPLTLPWVQWDRDRSQIWQCNVSYGGGHPVKRSGEISKLCFQMFADMTSDLSSCPSPPCPCNLKWHHFKQSTTKNTWRHIERCRPWGGGDHEKSRVLTQVFRMWRARSRCCSSHWWWRRVEGLIRESNPCLMFDIGPSTCVYTKTIIRPVLSEKERGCKSCSAL